VSFVFQGPIPSAGIGAVVTTAHGLFSSADWIGELRVVNTAEGSPAALSGLYREDLLLAIDGVQVKSLTAGEAIRRLRGEPGTDVRLLVQRPSAKEPVTLTLRRQVLPALPDNMNGAWYN
jgi:C-terminal processing protease CtpA/Prc